MNILGIDPAWERRGGKMSGSYIANLRDWKGLVYRFGGVWRIHLSHYIEDRCPDTITLNGISDADCEGSAIEYANKLFEIMRATFEPQTYSIELTTPAGRLRVERRGKS